MLHEIEFTFNCVLFTYSVFVIIVGEVIPISDIVVPETLWADNNPMLKTDRKTK